jgi:hypothetical protein
LNLGQPATAIRFLSIRRVSSRWMPRLNGGGILGQSLKKGNARVAYSPDLSIGLDDDQVAAVNARE